jgi:hypothetical protein
MSFLEKAKKKTEEAAKKPVKKELRVPKKAGGAVKRAFPLVFHFVF